MTAARVLRLPLTGETVELDDGPATIALCQRAIRTTDMKFGEIAERAGVCTTTVSHLAYGDTKRPLMATVVRILMALGWSITASNNRHG